MDTINSSDLIKFLTAVTLMLAFGRGFGEVFRRFKQAAVVGEIIAGIVLGPTILGLISPDIYNWIFPQTGPAAIALDSLVSLSIIFLLLVVGFEIDLSIVLSQGKAALLTGTSGIIFPFVFGAFTAYFFPGLFNIPDTGDFIFPFFIGTALAISALPIIARTLMDLNLFKSKMGMTVMAAAMFNDFIGWIIFSVFLGLTGAGSHGLPVGWTITLTLLFVIVALLLFRKIFHNLLPVIQSRTSWPGGIISFVMVVALIGAIITEQIGVHSIFGAFIMGVAIGDSAHLSQRTKEIVNQFITNIFAPLFFVSIGLGINFIDAFDPLMVLVILIIGFAGKIIGCGIGAYYSGFDKKESTAIGFTMNARGVLEIVLAIVALQMDIINESIFAAIIVLVLLSSILTGPLVSLFTKDKRGFSLMELISQKAIYFTKKNDRKEVVKELCDFAASKYKLDKKNIFDAVWEREQQLPTGIQNYLAVPHAKVNIKQPVVSIAVSSEGINFEAPDGKNSKIICLLLTPKDKNELQLQLLAEIASKFKQIEAVENLLASKSVEEFHSKLKQL